MTSNVSLQTHKVRRFKKPSPFGGSGKWEYEIGEPPKKFDASSELLQASESKNV